MGGRILGDFQGCGATRDWPRVGLTGKVPEQGAGNAIQGSFGGSYNLGTNQFGENTEVHKNKLLEQLEQ